MLLILVKMTSDVFCINITVKIVNLVHRYGLFYVHYTLQKVCIGKYNE